MKAKERPKTHRWARVLARVSVPTLLGTVACQAPEEVTEQALAALKTGGVERFVAPSYADGLGGRRTLLEWVKRAGPPHRIAWSKLKTHYPGPSQAAAHVEGELQLEFDTPLERLTRTGRFQVQVTRDGRYQLTSGFLFEVRAVLELVQALRDCAESGRFLDCRSQFASSFRHHGYAPEPWLERLRGRYTAPVRVRPQGLRVEVRTRLTHADVYLELAYGQKEARQYTLRLTLHSVAGQLAIHALVLDPR